MSGAIVVLIVVVVVLAVAFPGFRYFALIAAVLAGAGSYMLLENERKRAEENRKQQAAWEAWSRSAIDLKELHFSRVHLKNRSYGPYMALDGVVANNGKHALGEFDVEVTLKDCEDKTKETNCKVVGQARGTASPGVPSGQSRSFNTSDLRFDNLPREVQVRCATQPCNAGRVFNWRVTEIRASR
jgi:hypothetical protein